MRKNRYIIISIVVLFVLTFVANIHSNDTYAADKITISKNYLKLKEGISYRLKLSGITTKHKWKSSNPGVAKVTKNGTVTAKKAGKTTISVKHNNKIYKCKLQVYSGDFNHKHKYKNKVAVNWSYLILDPEIWPYGSFSTGLVSGRMFEISDLPEMINFEAGTGWGNGGLKIYDGIYRAGKLIDSTHFKLDNDLNASDFYSRGDISQITGDVDVIDLEKLDWYCIHDQVSVSYVCEYCGAIKNNSIYAYGGKAGTTWDDLRNKNFTKYTHSKDGKSCTCRDFIRKQYGCLWLNVTMAPEDFGDNKVMKVTSPLIKEGVMVHYETTPISIKFSRCKHDRELVFCTTSYDYGPKNLVIDDIEHNRYMCLDCGAILYMKDIER